MQQCQKNEWNESIFCRNRIVKLSVFTLLAEQKWHAESRINATVSRESKENKTDFSIWSFAHDSDLNNANTNSISQTMFIPLQIYHFIWQNKITENLEKNKCYNIIKIVE